MKTEYPAYVPRFSCRERDGLSCLFVGMPNGADFSIFDLPPHIGERDDVRRALMIAFERGMSAHKMLEDSIEFFVSAGSDFEEA